MYARGGAIFNDNGNIDGVSGNFVGNYASSLDDSAVGGAVYNYGKLGDIRGRLLTITLPVLLPLAVRLIIAVYWVTLPVILSAIMLSVLTIRRSAVRFSMPEERVTLPETLSEIMRKAQVLKREAVPFMLLQI